MLACLYNGNVHIWNHDSQVGCYRFHSILCAFLPSSICVCFTQQLVKSFEITDLPGTPFFNSIAGVSPLTLV